MGGKAHNGRRVTRYEAESLFKKIQEDLTTSFDPSFAPYGPDMVLCGSYRRQKETCGDLDIVIIPDQHDLDGRTLFDTWCIQNFGLQKNGKKPARTGLIDGVQVEFYVASPDNLGTFLQMWTGSAYHNVQLRRKAKKMGYTMSQYGFRNVETKELVTCRTEEEVYNFLGIDFVNPNER
jgi:DNA polymerase (family 10)